MNSSKIVLLLGAIGTFSCGPLTAAEEKFQPPRDTPLVEIAAEKVSSRGISDQGEKALQINPSKWKAAETPNFYVHFRRFTEAKKVAREIEYNLAFVTHQLGVQPSSLPARSHVYVFEDASEWADFVEKAKVPAWFASFAYGDELFLNVREQGGFDSQTLAHETTHAVVSRIYKSQRWPIWLNEGFAEYMGSAAVADRKNQTLRRFQKELQVADMPLDELTSLVRYPENDRDVARLYQTGEKFVRFLMVHGKPEQFVAFVDSLLLGKSVAEALVANYTATFPTYEKFQKEFASYQGTRK